MQCNINAINRYTLFFIISNTLYFQQLGFFLAKNSRPPIFFKHQEYGFSQYDIQYIYNSIVSTEQQSFGDVINKCETAKKINTSFVNVHSVSVQMLKAAAIPQC